MNLILRTSNNQNTSWCFQADFEWTLLFNLPLYSKLKDSSPIQQNQSVNLLTYYRVKFWIKGALHQFTGHWRVLLSLWKQLYNICSGSEEAFLSLSYSPSGCHIISWPLPHQFGTFFKKFVSCLCNTKDHWSDPLMREQKMSHTKCILHELTTVDDENIWRKHWD